MTVEFRESPTEWQRDPDDTDAVATALWLMLIACCIAGLVITLQQTGVIGW